MKYIGKIWKGIRGIFCLFKDAFPMFIKLLREYATGTRYQGVSPEGRFDLSNFIDIENIGETPSIARVKDYKKEKIKVCIVLRSPHFWNSAETICTSFEDDSRYDVCILVIGEFENQTRNYIETNYHHTCCAEKEYDIEKEQPDILLITFTGTDEILARNCFSHLDIFKLVVAVTGELITYIPDAYEWRDWVGYRQYQPDYYIVDPLLHEYLGKRKVLLPNMLSMGNAKFDGIFESMGRAGYPEEWNKLKGKKVILWANSHGIYDVISYSCTFDLYAKAIFDYAKSHTDVGFIIRLHPVFLSEMRQYNFWSAADFEKLKTYCEKSENLVWDDKGTYNDAYYVADAILTDGFCGMILSALPLMKPICACYRFDSVVEPCHKEYVKNLYQAHSTEDMINFFDMVGKGDDPMYEQRKSAKDRYINHFDGNNGLRIKNLIEDKFFEKINTRP